MQERPLLATKEVCTLFYRTNDSFSIASITLHIPSELEILRKNILSYILTNNAFNVSFVDLYRYVP